MIKKPILITIFSISLSMLLFSGFSLASNLLIEANKQTFDTKSKETTFDGEVKVKMENIKAKSPKAYVTMGPDGKPDFAKLVNGVYAIKSNESTQSEIKANTIELTLLEKKMFASGGVRSMVSENGKPILTIKSNSQKFNANKNTITASGSVVMNYKEISTNSSSTIINMTKDGKPDKVNLSGAVKIIEDKNLINADSVIFNPNTNEMFADGAVKSKTMLDPETPVLIVANSQQYNKSNNIILANGNVKIIYKDYVASGPKATIMPENNGAKPNKIIFTGRSNIKEGARQVEADRIIITMDPKNFNAEGNVKTRFLQFKESKTDDTNKSKKGKPAKKQRSKKSNSDISLSSASKFDKNFQMVNKNEKIQDLKEDSFKPTKPIVNIPPKK